MSSRTLLRWTIQKNAVSHWAKNIHSLALLHKNVPICHEWRQRDHDIGLKRIIEIQLYHPPAVTLINYFPSRDNHTVALTRTRSSSYPSPSTFPDASMAG